MKKLLIQTPVSTLFIILFLLISASSLQAGMAVGTDSPHSSAEAEISSTDKGILIPRMTADQRTNISGPADGLLVYQTNKAIGYYYYDGGSWRNLSGKIPSMTYSDRGTQISTPTIGQLIYQINNTPGFYYYDGSNWLQLGATSGSSGPSLSFTNDAGPIALYPPDCNEVTVAKVIMSVNAGDELKIDYSLVNNIVATTDWSYTFEARLYRDGGLIKSDIFNFSATTPGTQSFPVAGSYVDTAPATKADSAYELRIIFSYVNNITSASTGNTIIMNIINYQ